MWVYELGPDSSQKLVVAVLHQRHLARVEDDTDLQKNTRLNSPGKEAESDYDKKKIHKKSHRPEKLNNPFQKLLRKLSSNHRGQL